MFNKIGKALATTLIVVGLIVAIPHFLKSRNKKRKAVNEKNFELTSKKKNRKIREDLSMGELFLVIEADRHKHGAHSRSEDHPCSFSPMEIAYENDI